MLATRHATLLIVDPNLDLQSRLRANFHADGHRTIPATCIADALVALAACRVDLVLVDGDSVLGPDGWDDLERLRAAAGAIPTVILATDGAVPFAGYRARGFAGLVAKGGDGDDLSTALAPLLAAARLSVSAPTVSRLKP